MAELQDVKSKRDLMGERLKAKYPDKDYPDDEAMWGQVGDDYDEYEKQLGGYRDREKELTDLLARDPHSAQFLTDMADGKDPWTSLISRIGIDGVKEMLEDPEKMEEYAESNRDYMEKLAKSKELEEQWRQNMQKTLAMLEARKQELGLTDDELDEAADLVRDITGDALIGVIKPETLDMVLKALNHDKDVAAADMEGEVRGRNAKAEMKLRKPPKGDGTTVLGGANNTAAPAKEGAMSIFDQAKYAR